MMRTFLDARGRRWDVAIERESWGTFVALFSPAGGGELRHLVLTATQALDAHRELESADETALRDWLARSAPVTGEAP